MGALGAGAAGCDTSPSAATVDGLTISQSALGTQLTQASGAMAQCALAVQEAAAGRSLPPVHGASADTVSTGFAAFVLDRLVQQTLEQRALAQRHAAVAPADVAAARQDFESQLVAAVSQVGSPCNLTGDALVAKLPGDFVQSQALLLAEQEKLEAVAGHVDVSGSALRTYYRAHIPAVTELCLDFIVANDQASAEAIHNQIAAGASFATAAQGSGANAAATPQQAEGPCFDPATLAQELGAANAAPIEALPDGGVAAPELVNITDPTTGAPAQAWLVFGVRAHQLVPFDSAESGLRRQLLAAASAKLTAALSAVARGAVVDLDPRYGTWTLARGVSV